MFVEINDYIKFLCEHKMTPNQFLLCYLTHLDKTKSKDKGIANIYRYVQKVTTWTESEVDDLLDRGYLSQTKSFGKAVNFDNFDVTEKFTIDLFISEDKFDDVWKIYPSTVPNFHNVRGPSVKLKAVDKEEVRRIYYSYVKTKVLHTKVMELLQWAVDNNQINMSIRNWVASKQWEVIEEEKKDYSDSSNMVLRNA